MDLLCLILTALFWGMLMSWRSMKSLNFSYQKHASKVFFGCFGAPTKVQEREGFDLSLFLRWGWDLIGEDLEVLVEIEECNLGKLLVSEWVPPPPPWSHAPFAQLASSHVSSAASHRRHSSRPQRSRGRYNYTSKGMKEDVPSKTEALAKRVGLRYVVVVCYHSADTLDLLIRA